MFLVPVCRYRMSLVEYSESESDSDGEVKRGWILERNWGMGRGVTIGQPPVSVPPRWEENIPMAGAFVNKGRPLPGVYMGKYNSLARADIGTGISTDEVMR